MKSNEVFREINKKHSVKEIAEVTGSKEAFVYKWSQPDGGKGSGGLNPLERILALLRLTKNLLPLHWLCQQMGGYFVHNPKVKGSACAEFLTETGSVMQEMGHLQVALADGLKKKNVSAEAAAQERALWEELKSDMERHIRLSEGGAFRVSKAAAPQARVG